MKQENLKTIHSHIYEPLPRSKNKAQLTTVNCSNSENCEMYKNGQCSLLQISIFSYHSCPYGKKTKTEGPTPRAQKFYSFLSDNKDKYSESLDKLKAPNKALYEVGDYIYLPICYLERIETVKIYNACTHEAFIKNEDFNVENLIKILSYNPRSTMWDTAINQYRDKEVPFLLKLIKERYPDLYNQIIEKEPCFKLSEKQLSNIGRVALLNTLKPNVGNFKDIHGKTWTYDGEYLTCDSPKSHDSVGFAYSFDSQITQIKIKPGPMATVKITSDEQVTDNTVYKD